MPKVSTVNIAEVWGYDELFPILQDAFRVLYNSYSDICISKKNNPYMMPEKAKRWFLEDAITDDLIENEYDFIKYFDYQLIPQYKNIKYKTRIDIAVNYRISIGKYDKLEIECKQLKPYNIDYIISGGINKFKTNKYAENSPIAGMLLYNTKDDISTNIESLNCRIETKISQSEQLSETDFLSNYQYTYKSVHKRKNNRDLDLYSCVFDFIELIKS